MNSGLFQLVSMTVIFPLKSGLVPKSSFWLLRNAITVPTAKPMPFFPAFHAAKLTTVHTPIMHTSIIQSRRRSMFLWRMQVAVGAGRGVYPSGPKYPVRRELHFANKLAIPGWMLNLKSAEIANRALDRMALALPVLPQGIRSWGAQIRPGMEL